MSLPSWWSEVSAMLVVAEAGLLLLGIRCYICPVVIRNGQCRATEGIRMLKNLTIEY